MHTSAQFLDELRQKLNLSSDYQVHKVLDVSTQQVSRYRHNLDGFSDEMAEKVALLLGMDVGYVMACSHAQRSKKDSQKASWLRVAAVLLASALPPSAGAALLDNNGGSAPFIRPSPELNIHYRALRRVLAALGLLPPDHFSA